MIKNKKNNKKNSNKKNVSKRRRTSSETSSGKEIMGLFLVVIGIVFFISLYSQRMGIIGTLIYKLFSVISGSGNFIIPLLLIFWGILYNIQATKFHMRRYIICSLVIFFCRLHSITTIPSGGTFLQLNLFEAFSKLHTHGGWVGRLSQILNSIIKY